MLCGESLEVRPIPKLSLYNLTKESCVVQFQLKKKNFVIFAIYRLILLKMLIIYTMLQDESLRWNM